MSEFEELKKPKRLLKNISFQGDNAALSYTTGSGAASLKNESYLFKSLDPVEQNELSEGAQAADDDNTGVNQEVSKSNDNINEEGDQMTDQVSMEKFVSLQKKLANNELAQYSFEADVQKGLVDLVVGLDDEQSAILFKAFDAIVSEKEEALNKALEGKKEEEVTPLQKALDKEEGHQEVEAPVAKSLVAQAADILDEQKGA